MLRTDARKNYATLETTLSCSRMDVYKTWTPGLSTIPVDLVHGPLRGPSSWTTPVDHLLFFKMNFKVRVRFSRTLMNKTVPIIYIYY